LYSDCPDGFTYLPSVNGGCYKVVTERLSWDDAGLKCRSLHREAHLVVINDAAEQSAVAGMLSSVDSQYQRQHMGHRGSYYYWSLLEWANGS